jgi:hypothetical protein
MKNFLRYSRLKFSWYNLCLRVVGFIGCKNFALLEKKMNHALADLKLAGEDQPLQAADAGVFQVLDSDGFEGSWHDGSADCLVKPPAIDLNIAHYGEKYKQDLFMSV